MKLSAYVWEFVGACDVLLSALVHVQHQCQSSKGLSPKNLENQNEDQIRSNLERGDGGVGNASPHSTSPSELTSVLPWDPEGDKRLRCITSFFLFPPPPDFSLFPTFLLCYYSSTAFCCMLSKADRRGLPSETWRRLRCRHHLCSNPPVSLTLHSAPRL